MDSLSDECVPDEPNEAVPKIRIFWSDGTGIALWNQRIRSGDRTWYAPPAADYTESLHASKSGMFLRCFHSKHPQLSGSADCGDLFDADSYAVRCTQAEAVQWLKDHGYTVPSEWSSGDKGGQTKRRGGREPSPKIAKRNKAILADFAKGLSVDAITDKYPVSAALARRVKSDGYADIRAKSAEGVSIDDIAAECEMSAELVQKILDEAQGTPPENRQS